MGMIALYCNEVSVLLLLMYAIIQNSSRSGIDRVLEGIELKYFMYQGFESSAAAVASI
jgi:hypothetical protein